MPVTRNVRVVGPIEAVRARAITKGDDMDAMADGSKDEPLGIGKGPVVRSVPLWPTLTGHPNCIADYDACIDAGMSPGEAVDAVKVDTERADFAPFAAWAAHVTERGHNARPLPGRMSQADLARVLGLNRRRLGARIIRWQNSTLEGEVAQEMAETLRRTPEADTAPASPDSAGGVVGAAEVPEVADDAPGVVERSLQLQLNALQAELGITKSSLEASRRNVEALNSAMEREADAKNALKGELEAAAGAKADLERAMSTIARVRECAEMARARGCSDAYAVGYVAGALDGVSAQSQDVKQVRAITGLGLKEAKDLVESASMRPVVISNVGRDEADDVVRQLEDDVGAAAERVGAKGDR